MRHGRQPKRGTKHCWRITGSRTGWRRRSARWRRQSGRGGADGNWGRRRPRRWWSRSCSTSRSSGSGAVSPGERDYPPRRVNVREKAKALYLAKFKGLDETMPATMWLKSVTVEVRRQAVTMGVEWSDDQIYHESASHLDSEAKRWFATGTESVSPKEESITTLAEMLHAKYMTQRTDPKLVDRLNARRQ
ncbi:hypothetical protein GN958_ATG01945 [Phytophthora infestans]|uniref:Uncharacterized protein n=1 Tax=Phytophthora infestans TaxID=4787 RepID=A0A8S9V7K8_PHYIN|nr:hypothetical protein GN958_ATG01945 [Phytophthora infestans]